MIINYVGKELDNFSVARLWRKYVIYSLKKYFKDKKVLEVGSGIGSFSELIIKDAKSLTMLEPDKNFSLYLKKKFKDNNKVIEIINGTTENIKANKYDAIIISVGHDQFKKFGITALRNLGKPHLTIYDLKETVSKDEVDLRF